VFFDQCFKIEVTQAPEFIIAVFPPTLIVTKNLVLSPIANAAIAP
jgi:hypothetical protein